MTEPSAPPTPAGKLRVFISWSLPLSHAVALILRDWLPRVIQGVDLWVSSEDIEKGTWWNQGLIEALEGSTVGIVVITPANLERAWINFEEGALARAIRPVGGAVAPLLVNVPGSSIEGPLGSLQVTRFERADVFKLVEAVNARIANPLKDDLLHDEFDLKWPMLQTRVNEAIAQALEQDSDNARLNARPPEEILEDLVTEVRELRQEIKDPNASLFAEDVLKPVSEAFLEEGLHLDNIQILKIDRSGTVTLRVSVKAGDGAAIERALERARAIPKYNISTLPGWRPRPTLFDQDRPEYHHG